jgi:tetratricopeptide (TPR) repeat protein
MTSPLGVPPKRLFVGLWRARYSWKMGCARSWAPALGALGLVALIGGCSTSRQAGAALDAGRRATLQGDLLEALEHATDSATAQLALGEAAEALGEFDAALSAYQAAARRSSSTRTWLRLGEVADRMGQVDVAIQSFEHAYGPWREHASLGVEVGVVMFGTCVPKAYPSVSDLWTMCLPLATRIGRTALEATYNRVLTMNRTDAHRQTEGPRALRVAVRLEPDLDDERRFLDAPYGRDARRGPTPFGVR